MQERRQPETLRLRAVTPMITVTDLQASLAWYRDVLGFILAEEYKQGDQVVGVRLMAGAVQLLLTQDDFAKGRDRKKGIGLRLYCTTAQDVDQLAAAIKERGGQLAQEPTDQPWGARDFAVVDPDGFNVSFMTEPKG
ncbi:MAG TPA: VOC family protein [Thermoanaerobaculia bacterium]|nr:VOC family protein [Thermoanaerobaculia bacterium]